MPCLRDSIQENTLELQGLFEDVRKARFLTGIILATLKLVLKLGLKLVEEELYERAQRPTEWPKCPKSR